MSQIYEASQADLKDIIALSDQVFRKPGQTSMGEAFPFLFSGENLNHLLIIKDKEKPVSLIGLLPATLHIHGSRLPVVSMGSVCTAAEYRGRQYATRLLTHALEKVEAEGTALLLVSGDRQLYRRADCLSVGETQTFLIYGGLPELHPQDTHAAGQIRPWKPEDTKEMLTLLRNERAYYERTEQQFDQLIQAAAYLSCFPAAQQVWVHKSGAKIDGYLVFGLLNPNGEKKGEVIEFAGTDTAVLQLIQQAMIDCGISELIVTVPNYRRKLADQLIGLECASQSQPIAGTIRLVDLTVLWESLSAYFTEVLGRQTAGQLRCEKLNNGYRISLGGDSLVFDRRGAMKLVLNGPALVDNTPLKQVLSSVFPIPFVHPNNLNYV